MGNLGVNYLDSGRIQDALKIHQEAWGLAQKYRPFTYLLFPLPGQVGATFLICKQYSNAEPLLREALQMTVKLGQEDTWRMARVKTELGVALVGLKKYDQAEAFLKQGFEGIKRDEARIALPKKSLVNKVIQGLIDLYSATNRPDLAAKWRDELDKSMAQIEQNKLKTKPGPETPKK